MFEEQSPEATADSCEGGPAGRPEKGCTERHAAEIASGVIRKASEAVAQADAEFKKAKQTYEDLRQQATERYQAAREKRVGDLIDGTLEAVRKHPGIGVAAAATVGFFIGRIFRRVV